jgi:hypothetical protein
MMDSRMKEVFILLILIYIQLPEYIQSPGWHGIHFNGSGFQPGHFISRLETAPTIL